VELPSFLFSNSRRVFPNQGGQLNSLFVRNERLPHFCSLARLRLPHKILHLIFYPRPFCRPSLVLVFRPNRVFSHPCPSLPPIICFIPIGIIHVPDPSRSVDLESDFPFKQSRIFPYTHVTPPFLPPFPPPLPLLLGPRTLIGYSLLFTLIFSFDP